MTDQTSNVNASENKSGSSKPIFIACCLLILCIICLCCSAFIFLFGSATFSAINIFTQLEQPFSTLCSTDEKDLELFYRNYTSKAFKENTDFTEFQEFLTQYSTVFIDCEKLQSGGLLSILMNGANMSQTTENGLDYFSLKYNSNIKVVTVEFVKEGGIWKVNAIQIK